MNRVLNRRILRDLRANIGRYIALMLMIILGIYLVVSIVGSAEMVIQGTDNAKSENLVEDGEFSMFQPLSSEDLEMLAKRGTVIEQMFSFDKTLEDGSEVRIFKIRENVNRVALDEGAMPQKTRSIDTTEAVIEKNYARVHEIKLGDTLRLGDRDQPAGDPAVDEKPAALPVAGACGMHPLLDASFFNKALLQMFQISVEHLVGDMAKAESHVAELFCRQFRG